MYGIRRVKKTKIGYVRKLQKARLIYGHNNAAAAEQIKICTIHTPMCADWG